jgi:hypothetical protein
VSALHALLAHEAPGYVQSDVLKKPSALSHSIILPSVILPSVILPSVILPSVILPSVILPSCSNPSTPTSDDSADAPNP